MKKLRNAAKGVIVFLAVSLTFIFSLLASCEIGLGGAVDTQPPSLVIQSPKVDAVIRDNFAITGTWNDDGTISKVRATLKRTDGKGTEIKIDGTFDHGEKDGGTWKVLVNYKENKITDGTYQATIAIRDKSEHETTQSTTFTIDNTPPVLVLSRPSIKDGQSGFDSYGRSFSLEGKAADDNDVSLIEVKIYENADSTEPMKVVELKNVPLTIEQDVAVYDAAKANDYAAIYGHTDENGIILPNSNNTEQRYCTITIYDGAEKYPVDGSAQTDEDKKGNSTDVYYMNSEIATLLQGAYKITDLYHIMNGNYGIDATRAASAENVKTLLNGYKVTKSKFSINPANNPRFIVSSGNALESGKNLDNVDYQLTAGNRYLEVEITPGLDGYPIDPATVGVYLLQCDEDGNVPDSNPEKIWLINPGNDWHKSQEEAEGQDFAAGYGIYTVSGSTYKFKTSKLIHKNYYNKVKTGNYYLVKVQGNDSQGEESGSIISDGIFAFKLVSNEEKIELSAHGVPDYLSKTAAAWAVPGHESFTVELSWTTNSEGPFYAFRQKGITETPVLSTPVQENNTWTVSETFNYTQLKALAETGQEFPDKISYILKNKESDGDTISTTARITLKYDENVPSISNVQFSNSYLKEETDENTNVVTSTYYVRNVENNTSVINGIATDDTGIESVQLVVDGSVIKNSTDGRFKFEEVDFYGYSGTGRTAQIVATDVAGNQVSYPLVIVFDTDAPVAKHESDAKGKDIYFNVTEKDNDDISPTNPKGLIWNKVTINGKLYEGIDTGVGGKYGAGTYSNSGTIKIKGVFDDDGGSGVKMIYYKIYDRSNPLIYNSTKGEERHDLSPSELESLKADVLSNKKYFAPLANSLPKRVFYNVEKGTTDTQGGTLLGSVSDYTNKEYYKYWKLVDFTYEATITGFNEGSNYLVLVVEDNVRNTRVNTATVDFPIDNTTNPPTTEAREYSNISMNIDSRGPEITVPTQDDGVYTNGGDLYLTVEVIDPSPTDVNGQVIENACSGVDTVQFITERAGVNYSVDAEKVEGQENKWKANIKNILPDSESGISTIRVNATDVAGTSSKVDYVAVTIDKKPPVVTFNSPSEGLTVNKKVVLSGTVSDGNGAGVNTNIEPVLYWTTNESIKDTNPDPTALAANAQAGWVQLDQGWDTETTEDLTDWKFTVNTLNLKPNGTKEITDGTLVYFTVSAKDNAGTGNTGYAAVRKLKVDQNSDRPTIKFTNVNITNTMSESAPIWITKQEIYGSVQDDDGEIEDGNVWISFNGGAEDSWTDNCYTKQDGFHFSFPTTGELDGPQTIYFKVKDKAGTTFTSSVVTNNKPDTSAPKLAYQQISFGDETGKYSTVLYANVDLQDPTIPCVYYSEDDYSNIDTEEKLAALFDTGNYKLPANTSSWKDLSTLSKALGGTKSKIYILVKAIDANGINSIASTFGQTAFASSKTNKINTANEKSMAALYCLDVSGIEEVSTRRLSFTTTDNATHTHTSIYDISIDNVAPSVAIDRPTANSEIYGTENVPANNVTVSGRTSDANSVAKVYMTYTKGGVEKPAKPADNATWYDITRQSPLTWSVVFDKKNIQNYEQEDMYVYHSELFNNIVDNLYGANTTTSSSEKEICLWFYAEDDLGNNGKANPTELPLKILTQGDKPTVSISYPTQNITVGGVITISGGTSIATSTVSDIWLQVDPDYNGSFDENWETKLSTLLNGYSAEDLGYEIENIKDSENVIKGRGIKADGSKQSWNKIINMASEFVKYDTDNNGNTIKVNRDIGVRAYAMSETGKISEPVTVSFTLDPESPTFGNNEPLTLVQYVDDDPTKAIIASKLYENGMWIQGKWWLTGSVEDESGIDFVNIKDNDNNTERLSQNYYTIVTTETGTFNGYKLKIPVGKPKNSETTYGPEFTLYAKEKDGSKTSQFDIKFNYDNVPPEFESTTLSSDQANATTLRQSDGVCEIKGTFSDGATGSGFSRIVFYVTRSLTREGVTSNYITDIMAKQGTNAIGNCLKISTTEGTVHNDSKLYLDSGLYWKKITGCSAQNNIEIVIPSAKVSEIPAFLKKGGVCRINDIIYRIENITNGNNGSKIITIDSKIASSNNLSVEFAHAQVIDHTLYETGITTFYGDPDSNHIIRNDDDDEMQESVMVSSGTWSVSINSKNITDGTINIHFVAYDQAGNQTEKTYYASVANNAPRLAGIKFGTDVNGNEQVDKDELRHEFSGLYWVGKPNQKPNVSTNGYAANGEPISILALPNDGTYISEIDEDANAIMTVKGGLTVIPEIVGGNYGISWNYTVGDNPGTRWNANTSTWSNSASDVWLLNNNHGDTDDVRDAATTTISLSTLELLKNTTEGLNTLGFKLWDHTEGTTPGVNSNYAQLLIKVNVALKDSEKPTAGIQPFYWKSATENSLAYDTSGNPMGHIELESDLPVTGFDYAGTDGPEFDLDPKVSGVIYLEGFAKDNVAVEKLRIKIADSGFSYTDAQNAANNQNYSTDFGVIAMRDRNNNSSTKGQLISVPSLAANGLEFDSYEEKTVQDGNNEYDIVYWKIKIDTSKISTVTKTNVLIQVKAEDRGSATLNNSSTNYNYLNPKTSDAPETFVLDKNQTGYKLGANGSVVMEESRPTYDSENQTPSYRIDIVPYIAKIYTYLSKLKSNNWSVYGRTALGHYAVAADEKIYLYGFNLGNSTNKPEYNTTTLDAPVNGTIQQIEDGKTVCPYGEDYAAYDVVKFPVANVSASGQIDITVNSIKTLNNMNNTGAKGSSTKTTTNVTGDKSVYDDYYNRQPNGDNNNLLTDDVELDVWQINSQAGKPKGGPLSQPVMAINPVNKQVGFAFANGPLHYSMGDLTTSYNVWEQGLDFWTSIGFAYDANGNSFGTTAGGDINGDPSADSFGIFTSRWGRGIYDNKGGHNNGTGQLRLELLGQAESSNGSSWNGDNINKQRIKSSSIATTVSSDTATSTNVYLAYYDEINDEIRFKWGIFSNGNNTTGRSQNNLMYDYYGPENGDGKPDSGTNTRSLRKTKKVIDCPYTLEYVSLIAGQTKNKWTKYINSSGNWATSYKADTSVMTNETTPQPVCAGQYVSIAAKYHGGDTYNIGTEEEPNMFTDDLVVAVWYDATNNQMLYSYNTAPQKIKALTYKSDDRSIDSYSQSATGWSKPVAIFGEGNGIGEYCKVVIDGVGNVHIACYDNSNADVWYAYISDATNPTPANTRTCMVDSYGIVGTELYLDVAFKDEKPVPYISYYGSSCARPKVSYYVGTTSIATASSIAGADDEKFTKNWESSIIPSSSKISIDHINVGVWKDNSGNLVYSTTDGLVPNGINPGSTGANVGKCSISGDIGMIYGNGSKNPILGYAITKGAGGFIETAQMK